METREEQEGHADPEAASDTTCHSEPPETLQATQQDKPKKKDASVQALQTLPLEAPHTDTHSPAAVKIPTPRLIHPYVRNLSLAFSMCLCACCRAPSSRKPDFPFLSAFTRLIRSLLRVSMKVRYLAYGSLSNVLFLLMYNWAVTNFGDVYVPSTIYAIIYLVFIPIQHAMASCMVFGWPQRYFASLTANVPIGLTAIALGSYLTAFLDRVDFDDSAQDVVRQLRVAAADGAVAQSKTTTNKEPSNGEFYSSLVVLIVTSFWSFILAVIVNANPETSEKKQL
jgi:hypothetical protein